jgi:hypothetical protein
MLRRFAILGCLAAACGGEGSWQRCNSSAECPAGTYCDVPVSGEQGVCKSPGTLALTSPAAGAFVGTNATATATLTLASASLSAPASVQLRLAGAPVASLLLQGAPAGQVATYAAAWSPAAGQNGPGSLDATATVDVAGTAVPVTSPAVAVTIDTQAPAIASATAACSGGCKRDSTLDVSAEVSDANLLAVAVSLDLEPGRAVPVTRNGNVWSASVALAEWPFSYFAQTVNVTVRAVDRAGNEATTAIPVDVTRLRWAYTSGGTAVTSPAITGNGTVVFGVSATSGQLRALHPDMTEAFMPLTLGNQAVAAAPSVGPTAIWVASGDGRVYAVALDGTGILNGSGCDTLSATVGVPALFGAGRDVALVGSTDSFALFAVRVSPSLCSPTDAGEAFSSSVAVAADGSAYAATRALTGATTLRRYTEAVTGGPSPRWSAAAGTDALAPLAIDLQGRVLVSSQNGALLAATDQGTSGSVTPLATLPAQAEASPLVLAGGDIVAGLIGGSVHRVTSDGTALWASPPDIGGTVRGLAALEPGLDGAELLAVSAVGEVAALRPNGTVAWSGRPTTAALSFPAVADAAAGGLPTAYAGSQDGKLYAIVVDGPLDAAAPWPKAHHDLANTANASSPLP